MNEKMKRVFDKEDVTGQQYNILRILRGAGKPISTLQIRDRMLDKMSDTSRIVDRLVLKGLAHEKDMDAIFGNLSESEAKTLNKLFDKIRQSD